MFHLYVPSFAFGSLIVHAENSSLWMSLTFFSVVKTPLSLPDMDTSEQARESERERGAVDKRKTLLGFACFFLFLICLIDV